MGKEHIGEGGTTDELRQGEIEAMSGEKRKYGVVPGTPHDAIIDKIALGKELTPEDRDELALLPRQRATTKLVPDEVSGDVTKKVQKIREDLRSRQAGSGSELTPIPSEQKPQGLFAKFKRLLGLDQ